MSTTPPDPYVPPSASLVAPPSLDPAAVRRPGLRRERAIRSLGLGVVLLAVWVLVFCLGSVPRTFQLMTGRSRFNDPALTQSVIRRGIGFAAVGLTLGSGLILVGVGLRRLRAWARWGGLVLANLLLVAILVTFNRSGPRGVRWILSAEYTIFYYIPGLFVAYCFLLFATPPAALIFSKPYRAAVRATPDLTPGTGWGARIVLGLMVLVALLMLLTGVTHTAEVAGRCPSTPVRRVDRPDHRP